jgi:hypothetical protein
MVYSYSSLATFKQCPAKFKFAYIDKVEVPTEPPSPAMERGTKIHNSVEDYLLGKSEFLHPDIHKTYGQFMMSLRAEVGTLLPEWKWGVTWDFKPCSYDAPNCMIHGYMDAVVVPADESSHIALYEWKTGKKYLEDHASQAFTYATALMIHHPERPAVDAMITYFDQTDYHKIMYPQGMMLNYQHTLRREIDAIVFEKRWPTKPTFKCKWCKFSRYNGGPCLVA